MVALEKWLCRKEHPGSSPREPRFDSLAPTQAAHSHLYLQSQGIEHPPLASLGTMHIRDVKTCMHSEHPYTQDK